MDSLTPCPPLHQTVRLRVQSGAAEWESKKRLLLVQVRSNMPTIIGNHVDVKCAEK